MPDASERSVNNFLKSSPPCRRHESQSWGSATAATLAALAFSLSASHLNFVAVNDATRTDPTFCAACASPPISALRSRADCAERVSFQRSAGRITSPLLSSVTIPCCWPPIEIAETSSRPPASAIALSRALSQWAGSTSVPSG